MQIIMRLSLLSLHFVLSDTSCQLPFRMITKYLCISSEFKCAFFESHGVYCVSKRSSFMFRPLDLCYF